MIRTYLRFFYKSWILYKDFRKLRKAVNHINGFSGNGVKEEVFNHMLDEKLLQCDIRISELDHGIINSHFPYPKKYERLYKRIEKINHEP